MSALSQSIHAATNIGQFMDADIRELTARGFTGVQLVTSDAYRDLNDSVGSNAARRRAGSAAEPKTRRT